MAMKRERTFQFIEFIAKRKHNGKHEQVFNFTRRKVQKKKSSIFAFELRKQSIDHAICYIKFSSIFRNQPFLFSRHKCR